MMYLLKASLALMLCWMLYHTAFRRLTFFQWNRFYLLASVVISLLMPLLRLQWGSAMASVAESGGIDWTPMDHLKHVPMVLNETARAWSPASLIILVYLAVALVLLVRSTLRSGRERLWIRKER